MKKISEGPASLTDSTPCATAPTNETMIAICIKTAIWWRTSSLDLSPYAAWPRAQTIWHATSCAYIWLASLLTDPTVGSHMFLF